MCPYVLYDGPEQLPPACVIILLSFTLISSLNLPFNNCVGHRVTSALTIWNFFLTESSEHEDKSTDASGDVPPQSCPTETPTLTGTDAPEEEHDAPKSPADSQSNDELGPLPDNWEMAYTEKGEVYFIEWVKCTLEHASN